MRQHSAYPWFDLRPRQRHGDSTLYRLMHFGGKIESQAHCVILVKCYSLCLRMKIENHFS